MNGISAVPIQYLPAAAAEWPGRMRSANIIGRLERETVQHGLRSCALLTSVSPEHLQETIASHARDGLLLVPFDRSAPSEGFSHRAAPARAGAEYRLRCVVARNSRDVRAFVDAERARDHVAIGGLLGFPPCCTRFFTREWALGCFDPIWPAARNTPAEAVVPAGGDSDEGDPAALNRIVLRHDPEACRISVCLRYVGIRIVSHLPCSARCHASTAIARKRIELARRLGMPGLDEALELLGLPYTWTCHRGTATVSTPLFVARAPSMNYESPHLVRQL